MVPEQLANVTSTTRRFYSLRDACNAARWAMQDAMLEASETGFAQARITESANLMDEMPDGPRTPVTTWRCDRSRVQQLIREARVRRRERRVNPDD